MPSDELLRLATAWTVGLDTMARAALAAVTAVAETQLRSTMADALSGKFADWVFVNFLSSPPRRAVSAREPDPGLVAALGEVAAQSCPVISSAVSRCTPEVRASIDDEWMLGGLPDGRAVASVIGARSVAVGPILAGDGACGRSPWSAAGLARGWASGSSASCPRSAGWPGWPRSGCALSRVAHSAWSWWRVAPGLRA